MASDQLHIVSGPSKLDLMLALFDKKHAEPLSFKTSNGLEIKITVLTVQKEDGSCESWSIEGYVDSAGGRLPKGIISWKDARNIYFRTDTRRGFIHF